MEKTHLEGEFNKSGLFHEKQKLTADIFIKVTIDLIPECRWYVGILDWQILEKS